MRPPSLLGLHPLASRLLLLAACLGFICSNISSTHAQPADTSRTPITDLQAFWDLPTADRDKEIPIRVEILVDFYDPAWQMVWGRSGRRGYYIASGPKPLALQPGQTYLVEGLMTPSQGLSFAKSTLTLIPDRPPPPPADATARITQHELFQNQVVTIDGYVQRQFLTDNNHFDLEILSGPTLLHARILLTKNDRIPQLLDQHVRLTGVYVAKTTDAGLLSQLDLWVPSLSSIQTIGVASDDPRFEIPVTPIENLVSADPNTTVLVRGTVQATQSGQYISIRDGTGLVKVLSQQTRPLKLGESVEAIGKPAITGNEWQLTQGAFRPTIHEGPAPSSELRLAEQILSLSPEEASKGLPTRLTGMISWIRGSADFLYLQDPSSGIRVRLPKGFSPSRDMLYSMIALTGTTTLGKFAPEVIAHEIRAVGREVLPAPKPITLEQALTGVEESQLVEMNGYVRDFSQDEKWTQLILTTPAGEFTCRFPRATDDFKVLGSIVRITGICIAEANAQRELTGILLLAPNQYSVQIEDPAPANPFDIPATSVASLHLYSPKYILNRRARLTGQVIHHVPGRYLHLQDGSTGIFILSRSTTPLQQGDLIEVVGLPGRDANRVVLREAIYRKIGTGTDPIPVYLNQYRLPQPALDGRLARATGQLIQVTQHEDSVSLLIQNNDAVYEAKLESALAQLPPLATTLEITGVYQIDFDEYRTAKNFHLKLRSPFDIEILTAAPWWTPRRTLLAASALLTTIIAALSWVTILRRRVKHQTARIREQLAKEASLEARHSDIVENASDFIFTLDTSGRFTSFNAAGERITGYPRAEALQLNIRDLISNDPASEPLPLFGLQTELDGTLTFQSRFKTRDGRLLWMETNARLLQHHGLPAGVLGVSRDISERKQIEEELLRARDAAEANTRAKSAFLANMSHEIRTPMNGVIGMSNLLLNTRLSDEQRDFSETIRHSAESLLTILNDILDFSKIEAGKLHFETIDFDLIETVEITLELLAARASEKKIELASYLPHGLPRHVRGDPGRLRQVLLNLIGNAIKFTERGEVIVALAVEKETDHDVRLHFEITDTGPGIDVSTQATLFQPFQQADSSTTRKFGGTGLGLAISKQIVQLMDGQIGVRSTLGKGSTFWLTLQLEKQPYGLTREAPAPITALNGLRALIVDDNATNRKILQHYCANWGMRSEPTSNGPAALAALRTAAAAQDPFHLVLLDYQMPEMDGLTLAREIIKDPDLSHSRVVLLTSWDRRFPREELAECGIVRMLVKPVRQQDLLGALLRCVRIGFGNARDGTLPSRSESPEFDPPAEPTASRSLRILVAEDNIVNQRVSQMQLRNLGHTVDIAANGLEVLDMLERATYDLVFMDCQMPELDGYDTTRRIRQHPRFSQIRIVAMTANAMQGDREKCLDAGMDDYVTKPTRPDDLKAALARCTASLPPAA